MDAFRDPIREKKAELKRFDAVDEGVTTRHKFILET